MRIGDRAPQHGTAVIAHPLQTAIMLKTFSISAIFFMSLGLLVATHATLPF